MLNSMVFYSGNLAAKVIRDCGGYLEGKKSKISELMKEMRNLAPEERAGYGKSVNELKEWAIDRFSKMEEKMKQLELQRRYESEKNRPDTSGR